jgi:hypothetical protein
MFENREVPRSPVLASRRVAGREGNAEAVSP